MSRRNTTATKVWEDLLTSNYDPQLVLLLPVFLRDSL